MSVGSLLILFVIVGLLFAVRLPGNTLRRLALAYALGLTLALGGCFGALAWVGAETSGNKNLFHAVNPYVWSGSFVAGLVILVVNTVRAIRLRSRDDGASE